MVFHFPRHAECSSLSLIENDLLHIGHATVLPSLPSSVCPADDVNGIFGIYAKGRWTVWFPQRSVHVTDTLSPVSKESGEEGLRIDTRGRERVELCKGEVKVRSRWFSIFIHRSLA